MSSQALPLVALALFDSFFGLYGLEIKVVVQPAVGFSHLFDGWWHLWLDVCSMCEGRPMTALFANKAAVDFSDLPSALSVACCLNARRPVFLLCRNDAGLAFRVRALLGHLRFAREAACWSVWVPDLFEILDFVSRDVHAIAVRQPTIFVHALVFAADVCLLYACVVSVEVQA